MSQVSTRSALKNRSIDTDNKTDSSNDKSQNEILANENNNNKKSATKRKHKDVNGKSLEGAEKKKKLKKAEGCNAKIGGYQGC